MSSKAILVLCAQAFLIQAVFSQCTSRAAVDASGIAGPFGYAGPGLNAPFGRALAYDGLASPYSYDGLAGWAGRGLACDGIYPAMAPAMDFTPTSGGGLPVTSSSINAPTGISIMSENAYEGILSVAGELPFVGTTAMEGVVPSAGAGAINHACGNGINAMSALSATSSPASVLTSEIIAPYGMASPGFAGIGYTAPAFGAPAFGAPAWAAPGLAAPAMAYEGLLIEAPLEGIEFTATSGGALPVSSASPVPPMGISVASETAYEGPLAVVGELPFVGTVAVDGVVPSVGAGAVNHACGNGINAMVSETTAFGPGYAGAYGPASAFAPASGFRYPAGWAGRSCGYAI